MLIKDGKMENTKGVLHNSFALQSSGPRCSAASLVNWESEMKHCSSGGRALPANALNTRYLDFTLQI